MRGKSLFDLDGKNVAVIGAGSGIGAAVAAGCAAHGGRVVCLDIDLTSVEETAKKIRKDGGLAEATAVDVRERQTVESALHDISVRYQSLDVVISTPAINIRKPLLKYTDEDFEQVVGLNLKGSLHVLQSAGRIMAEQRSGSIIMFSSIRSRVVEAGQGVYAATKAGLEQMVRTLATELGPLGVRVNSIAPAVVDTALTAQIKNDADWCKAYADKSVLGRWATADELVGAGIFLASDASSYVTGSVLFVDGGWTAADGRFHPPGM